MSQEDLANQIKAIHSNLRKRCIVGENYNEIWQEHTSDTEKLRLYSLAMKELATEYWEKDKNRETRIVWTANYITKYFSSDGDLQRLFNKDKRSLQFHSNDIDNAAADPLRCCGKEFTTAEHLHTHRSSVRQELTERIESMTVKIPMVSGIRILDVGSCYGPFTKYSNLDCLSIDLYPACGYVTRLALLSNYVKVLQRVFFNCSIVLTNKEVLQCDFLAVSVHREDSCDTCIQASKLSEDKRSVTSLPQQWFHGVVFSLLLEYMPSPKQRWSCCVKAHEVLQVGSVLVIITPDSSKQHRRAKQMKDWKIAIEHIGFQRSCYQKLDHIHCMAFRKTVDREDYSKLDDMSASLYIPQDFNTKVDEVLERSDNIDSVNTSSSKTGTEAVQETSDTCSVNIASNKNIHSVSCDTNDGDLGPAQKKTRIT